MEDNKKKIIKIVVLVICIIVFLVSAGIIGWNLYENYKNNQNLDDLREQITEPTTLVNNIIEEPKPDYSDVLAKNNETVGWITIPGTRINHPVLQHPDDANHSVNENYYLKHTFEKTYSIYGAIYMDYRNDAVDLDTNTIIHGHNGYNGTNFSDLAEYDSFEFYKEHPVVEFNTLEKYYKWKIYAVFITNASASDDNGYVFNYVYPYLDGENFDDFIKEVDKRSLYNTGVDIQRGDKLLTLSTCCRNLDITSKHENVRIVVLARAVRYGEDETVDVSKAFVNENPKYPQLYYRKHGLTNPYKNDERWYPEEG